MPIRIQLKRTKGWRMPPGTVRVDRATRWGNPFNLRDSKYCWTALAQGYKADAAGRRAASVHMFAAWIVGGKEVTVDRCGFYAEKDGIEIEIAKSPDIVAPVPPSLDDVRADLRGKNLACWCSLCDKHKAGKPFGVECAQCSPCHSDVLLEIANAPEDPAP